MTAGAKEVVGKVLKPLGDAVGGVFLAAINWVLYILLGFFALLFSLAASVFAWAVDATVWQQLFNMKSVYNLWGMIRDFFNLFFILTLLFIAFCTIFQIQAYNYKKWLLNLVLMALLTNFSFPVARFLIDATNVPMYFFFDNAVGNGGGGVQIFESFIGGSRMNTLLFPEIKDMATLQGDTKVTGQLIRSIVFVFILASSLLVLAVLFLVRLVALVLLVIFSPVGFAGSAIPWTQSFSKKWWDYFFKYALFGPAAALMILVSVKFLQEFSGVEAAAQSSATSAAAMIKSKAAGTVAAEADANIITSMVTALIPVILIWTSISVGQMMGIAGGAKVAGFAQKFVKGTAAKLTGYNAGKQRWGSFKGEWDKRSKARYEANNVGSRLGRSTTLAADKVTSGKYFPGSKVSKNMSMASIDTAQQARVKEEAERNRINDRTSDAELLRQRDEARKKGDKSHLVAVVQEMRNRDSLQGEIERSDMESIEKHFKSRGDVTSAVFAETQQKVAEKNLHAAYGDNVSEMTKALKSGKVKMEDQTANALTSKVLQAGLESNKIDQKVLDELSKDGEKGAKITVGIGDAMDAYETAFTGRHAAANARHPDEAKALEKQRVAAHQAFLSHTGDFHSGALLATQNDVFKKADKTTFKKMSATEMNSYMPQIIQFTPSRKVVNIVSDLAEEDKTKAVSFISAIEQEKYRGNMDARDTIERLKDDHRTRKVTTYS